MILKLLMMLFIFLCMVSDLREKRIPNHLIVAFLIPLSAGAIYNGLPEDFMTLSLPILLILFLIWLLGFLGGADVKVFMVLSLALPGTTVLRVLCLTLALSLLVFLIRSIYRRCLVRSMPMMPFIATATLVIWL
ncbi:prepilin peptidase [Clostridia bacterium]|nr:prepilin peptidase [Clostridia bacterium]